VDTAGPQTPRPSPRGRARGQLTALHETRPALEADAGLEGRYRLADVDSPREMPAQPDQTEESARSADSMPPTPKVSRIGTMEDQVIGNATPKGELLRHGVGDVLTNLVDDSAGLLGEIADDTTASGTEGVHAEGSSKPSSTPSHGRLDAEGAAAPPAAAERPDFTGSWACIRVEGDTPGFLQDMGLTPLQREAARSARYGAGLQTQFITQDGDRFTVVDQLKTTNTMKFQVGLGPQTTCNLEGRPVTVTPTWEGQALCIVSTTDAGIVWASSRRFYEKDQMVLELSSPGGSTMRRIFGRKGGSGGLSSVRSTRLTLATLPSTEYSS